MKINTAPDTGGRHLRIGFWSALVYLALLLAVNVAFAVMAFQVPADDWKGVEAYADTYRVIAFVPQAFGLAAIPALVLMLAAIHRYAAPPRKVWALAGLSFGIGHALLLGSLYFIQLGIVLPALRSGDWGGLDQFVFANPRSIAWGLTHFAWALLGVTLLLMAWVFEGGGFQRWIRWLFIGNGFANASLVIAFPFELEFLTLAVAFASWVIALPLAVLLVALEFRTASASLSGGDRRRAGQGLG